MRRVIVLYNIMSDRVAEHERFVQAVFDELTRTKPQGLRYAAFKEPDGVSYVHLASIEADKNPLAESPAFQAFQAGLRDRCEVQPVATDLQVLGSYQLLPTGS